MFHSSFYDWYLNIKEITDTSRSNKKSEPREKTGVKIVEKVYN